MTDKSSSIEKRPDEMDLADLFVRMGRAIGKSFRALFRAIIMGILYLFSRWLVILIALVISVGLSLLVPEILKDKYRAEIIVRSNAVPVGEMIPYINRLTQMCREKNRPALAASLGIDEHTAREIVNIKAAWVIDMGKDGSPDYVDWRSRINIYDTTNIRMNDRLGILIKSRSSASVPLIRDGILSYSNGNNIFIQRNRVRLSQVENRLDRLKYDVEQLDSLQNVKYFEETRRNLKDGSNQMVFLQEQRTQLLYEDIYTLYEQYLSLEAEKELYSEIVTLVEDYIPTDMPYNSAIYYGKVVIPAFMVFALLLMIIVDSREKILKIADR